MVLQPQMGQTRFKQNWLDDHGDAHAADGFCMAVRKARVQGKVENGFFVATYFELLK